MTVSPSPIARRSAEAEAAHLAELTRRPWAAIHTVSDLHLGQGSDSCTGTFAMTENFTGDGAFERFLRSVRGEATGHGLLILLGDTFDFLRITSVPAPGSERDRWRDLLLRLGEPDRAAETAAPVRSKEKRYGLRTDDWKSAWKLDVMLRGHPGFLRALVDWLSAGHGLVIAKGNHDVELYWPLIQQAIRDALVQARADAAAVERNVAFADGGFVVSNVYFEHGHQYESMTRVAGPPVLDTAGTELNLPLGSFVNRYFINSVERLDPFIDNRKPVQQALLALLRRRPVAIIKIYTHGYPFLEKTLSKAFTWHGAGALLLLATLGIPLVAIPITLALIVPASRDWIQAHVPFLNQGWVRVSAGVGSVLPALLPYAIGAAKELWRDLVGARPRDELAEGAVERLGERATTMGAGTRWAVMGHTHRQLVCEIKDGDRNDRYINTGTWIPLWPAERPDLQGRIAYSVTRFLPTAGGGFAGEALHWNDDAGELRPATILIPTDV